jgi:hypothetical protein
MDSHLTRGYQLVESPAPTMRRRFPSQAPLPPPAMRCRFPTNAPPLPPSLSGGNPSSPILFLSSLSASLELADGILGSRCRCCKQLRSELAVAADECKRQCPLLQPPTMELREVSVRCCKAAPPLAGGAAIGRRRSCLDGHRCYKAAPPFPVVLQAAGVKATWAGHQCYKAAPPSPVVLQAAGVEAAWGGHRYYKVAPPPVVLQVADVKAAWAGHRCYKASPPPAGGAASSWRSCY